jgi:hypothetical protein
MLDVVMLSVVMLHILCGMFDNFHLCRVSLCSMSWRRHSVTRFLSYRIWREKKNEKNVTTKFFAAKILKFCKTLRTLLSVFQSDITS